MGSLRLAVAAAGLGVMTACSVVAGLSGYGVAPASEGGDAGPGTCLPGNILDLSVGEDTACVVHCDGTVWCWGGNGYGQLGEDGGADDRCTARYTNDSGVYYDSLCRAAPRQVEGIAGAVQVSVGMGTACAVI